MERERWVMGIVLLIIGFGLGYLAFGNTVANSPMYRLGGRGAGSLGGGSSSGGIEGMMWPGKMIWRNDREAIGLGADFDPEQMRGWCLERFATSSNQ